MFDRFRKGDVLADARRAVEVISAPSAQPDDAQPALERMLRSAKQTDRAQLDAAVRVLAEAIPTVSLGRAAYLALGCGALVEQGADATPAAEPILFRTAEALAGALPFLEACRAAADAAGSPPSDDEEEEEEGDKDSAAVERFGEQIAATMPDNARAFGSLGHWRRPRWRCSPARRSCASERTRTRP
jgi:hypothetical protein